MSTLQCSTNRLNISKPCSDWAPGHAYALVFAPYSHEFATEAAAILETNWDTLINSSKSERCFIVKEFDNIEPDNEETPFYEGNTKRRHKLRDGYRRIRFTKVSLPPEYIKALRTMDDSNFGLYIITMDNWILAKSIDDVKVQAMPVRVYVDTPTTPAGGDELYQVMFTIEFEDSTDYLTKAVTPDRAATPWSAKNLDGLIDVELTEVSASATSIVFDMTSAIDGSEIDVDFVIGDFETISGASAIAHSGNRYTISGTGMASTTVQLLGQPDMTTKGYEQPTGLSVTI